MSNTVSSDAEIHEPSSKKRDAREDSAAQCLPALFEAQVAATPDVIALVFQDQRLSYRELDARANRLARYLISRGVGPEVLVALALERSVEMIVALLAVLKAGGAYVPLDPEYPAARVEFMIENSRAKFLITTASIAGRFGTVGSLLVLDEPAFANGLATCSNGVPNDADRISALSSDNLAYAIYTSGSTGRPKGVGITHKTLVGLLSDMGQRLKIERSDVLLALTTIAFDIAALEIFLPLIRGAQVALVDRDVARDPALIKSEVSRLSATIVQTTPSRWSSLIDAGVTGVRVLVGGEALTAKMGKSLQQRVGSTINLYGPTETTIWSMACAVSETEMDDMTGVPIGRPITGTDVYVVDPDLTLVSPGETGEIFIAGGGLARGYLNSPALTAERFIACPFGPPGARMYRTGDLGTWRPDGNLEFLGRADQQVKIRGFRIEPGEIEAVLLEVGGIGQTTVVSREVAGETRLVAYIVPKPNTDAPKASDIRAALEVRLPDYMIPSAFVTLDALPLTINGKLDRRALPEPSVVSDALYRGPGTETEKTLCALFKRLTGADRVSVDDSFFDLGGHSLLGVRLMVEIEKTFSKRLPLAALFHAPTVAELARLFDADAATPEWRSLTPIHLGGSAPPIFIIQWLERDLARHLGAERPVWGLSVGLARGFVGSGRSIPRTVEETAAHYIEEMQSVRPNGPYLLIGHSAGGVLAFEMARQLTAAGHPVAFLGMLDTDFPRPPGERTMYPWSRQLRNILGTPPKRLVRFGFEGVKNLLYNKYVIDETVEPDSSMSRSYRALFIKEMMNNYKPDNYDGKIYFIKSTSPNQSIRYAPPPAPELDWATKTSGGLEVQLAPGDHMEIVKNPLAANTAALIEACLKKAGVGSETRDTPVAALTP